MAEGSLLAVVTFFSHLFHSVPFALACETSSRGLWEGESCEADGGDVHVVMFCWSTQEPRGREQQTPLVARTDGVASYTRVQGGSRRIDKKGRNAGKTRTGRASRWPSAFSVAGPSRVTDTITTTTRLNDRQAEHEGRLDTPQFCTAVAHKKKRGVEGKGGGGK